MVKAQGLCVFCKEKEGIYKKTCCASPFCSVACGKNTDCCDKSSVKRSAEPEPSEAISNTEPEEKFGNVKELNDVEKWQLSNNAKLINMLKDQTVQNIFRKIAKSTITGNETLTLSQYVQDPEFMAIADEIVSTIEKASGDSDKQSLNIPLNN